MSTFNQGLDYFSLEVNLLKDAKIIKLMQKYGPLGLTCYFMILINVFAQGYYAEYSINDLAKLLLNEIGGKYISGKDKLQEIILFMASIDLIDGDLLVQNIISSVGIQRRFLLATKKRKQKVYQKYWILPEDEDLAEEKMDSDVIEVTAEKQPKEPPKCNKKERPVKAILEGTPKKHFLTACLITYRYIEECSLDLYRYNNLFEDLLNQYEKEQVYDAVRYLCNWASRASSQIDDRYKFFEVSIKKNLENRQRRNTFNFDDWLSQFIKSK
jgi:hypothetical protein